MPASAPSSPMLLSEHAKEASAAAKKFALSIYTGGDSVLRSLKFKTDSAFSKSVQQVTNDNLGTVNFGQLDEQPAETRSDSRKVSRSVYLTSDMISVDRRLLRAWRDGNVAGGDPIQRQFDSYAATLKSTVGYRFIVNNPVSGEVDFEAGLWHQLNSSANREKYDIHSDMNRYAGNGGTPLDLTPGSGTAANAMKALEHIRILKHQMTLSGGSTSGIKMVMDFKTRLRIQTLFSASSLFDQRKDQYDNTISSLDGMDIIETGVLASTPSTEIISTVETDAGTALTGGKSTSVYLINTDTLWCWQPNVMEPEKLPDNGNFHEWLLNWGMGYLPLTDRAFGRVYGIEVTD